MSAASSITSVNRDFTWQNCWPDRYYGDFNCYMQGQENHNMPPQNILSWRHLKNIKSREASPNSLHLPKGRCSKRSSVDTHPHLRVPSPREEWALPPEGKQEADITLRLHHKQVLLPPVLPGAVSISRNHLLSSKQSRFPYLLPLDVIFKSQLLLLLWLFTFSYWDVSLQIVFQINKWTHLSLVNLTCSVIIS